jgi:PIN domain nuclease of toxin-antitoxin system
VKVLLDTLAFLWWNGEEERLSDRARAAIADPTNTIAVSAITAWEIVIKAGLGRLRLEEPADIYVASRTRENSFEALPFTLDHALRVAALPDLHRDPFDRALVAQAAAEALPLLTADPIVRSYPIETYW